MTYNLFGGTLNLAYSQSQSHICKVNASNVSGPRRTSCTELV